MIALNGLTAEAYMWNPDVHAEKNVLVYRVKDKGRIRVGRIEADRSLHRHDTCLWRAYRGTEKLGMKFKTVEEALAAF